MVEGLHFKDRERINLVSPLFKCYKIYIKMYDKYAVKKKTLNSFEINIFII